MAKILKADGTTAELAGTGKGGRLTLEEMQKAVGGYVEICLVKGGQLVVNEDGIPLGLPVNEAATNLYVEKYGGGRIFGDAVYCAGRTLR